VNDGNNNVDINIRGKVDGLKTVATEAKSTVADLKDAVVDNAAQMTGVNRDLLSSVSDLAPRFLLVGAAVAVAAKAYADGVAEVKEMNLAIAKGGDISGQSAASLRELSGDIATHSRLTIAESKGIASALASSGQIGAAAFRQVSQAAGDFARVTGTDVARVGPELVKLFADPAKGAEELNRQMHFLSAAELDHIEHLTRMGEVTEAQIELSGKLKDRLGEIAPPLGILERAWDGVKGASSKAWDAMMGLGREQTTQDRLNAVYERIRIAEAMGTTARNLPTDRQVPALMRQALKLQDQLEVESQKSFDKSQAAEQNRREQRARSIINSNSTLARAKEIDDEIALVRKAGNGTAEADQAIAKLQEKRAKLFAEKKTAKHRDVFLDTVTEASGVNRNFATELGALKAGLDAGRISEEAYIGTVEKLILKQPFATKDLQETIKELALKERVLNKVDAAETAAREVIEKAGEAHTQRNEELRLEIELLGKNATERAKLTAFRKIDAALAKDEARLTDRLGKIGDLDGIDSGVAQLRAGAEEAKAAWADAHDTIEARSRSWLAGARDGLQSYADEAARSADAMANAFKRGAQMAEDAIANFVVTGKLDIASLLKFAATEMARQNIAKPLVSAGTDWLKGLLGGGGGTAAPQSAAAADAMSSLWTYSANGNAFDRSGVIPFARGGIVDRPTLFPFAQGTGLMGEAGPEAILPLTRGPGGKLGVQASGGGSGGGGGNVTVIITESPSQGGQVRQRDDGGRKIIEIMVAKVKGDLIQDVRNEGTFAKAAQLQWGLNRAAGAA